MARRALLGAAWLLSTAPAAAARWSTAAYVGAALAAAPELEQSRQGVVSAEAGWKADLADSVLPSLSFSANAYPWGDNPLNSYAFTSWRLRRRDASINAGLTWTLFNSFADALRVKSAHQALEIARRSLDDARQSAALKALKAYYGLQLQRALAEVAKQDLNAQQEQYRLTQDLYKHGMKSLSDLLKTETDWRSSELRMADAEAELALAQFRFNQLLDRPEQEGVELEPAAPPAPEPIPPLEADLRRAALGRPDMVRLRLEAERAATAMAQSVRNALPALSFAYQRNYQESATFGLPSSNFGVKNPNHYFSLSLSLPTGFNLVSQAQRVRAARAEREASEASRRALLRTVREEIFSARVGLEKSQRIYAVSARKQEISRTNLELVAQQYRQGGADVIRLSQSRLDQVNAQVERMRALSEANISRAEYQRAVGEPLWR